MRRVRHAARSLLSATRPGVYVSSTGHGGPGPSSPVHVPSGSSEPAELLRLVEGELMADICTALTSIPTISVPGVSNWRLCLKVSKALGAQKARLAFDMDACKKSRVAGSLLACAEALIAVGYALEFERWNLADGKGLDDPLAIG